MRMGILQRIRLEAEVTFGEVGRETPDPDEAIYELLEKLGGLDIEVVIVDVEDL